MEGLFEKIEPRYDLLDEKWNVQPAATRASYKIVLFERKRGSEALRRERYVYEELPAAKSGKMEIEAPASLLKVPIKQLLQNVEERKREAERQRELDLKKMTSSSSALEVSATRPPPQPRRRLNEAYAPKSFMDLIGSDKTNRFALKWLKSWDHKVFKSVRAAHQPLPKNNSESPGKQDLYLQSLKKKGKYIQDQQTLYENLSLNKEKDILEMSSKMLMLSGASGSGKSTLATVIAKKCGYNPMRVGSLQQISLASESSLDALIGSMKNLLEGKSILEASKGPTLLILDDIDSFFAANTSVPWIDPGSQPHPGPSNQKSRPDEAQRIYRRR